MVQRRVSGWLVVAAIAVGVPARAQFTQSGGKLVGPGSVGTSFQGSSVALSADGSTAVVGGPGDNGGAGAAWVFTRTAGLQSLKLPLGTPVAGFSGKASQGSSVAISADANTLVVGGKDDNGGTGAMWIFAKSSNGVWIQQKKLWGTTLSLSAFQGTSVAVSADGNTAIIGGPAWSAVLNSDDHLGSAWVFTRTNGEWGIVPAQLLASNAVGAAEQGTGVAISADGNTAIVGGPGDSSGSGAAWVFARASAAAPWIQQAKLTGLGATASAAFGFSVAISADGNTAMVGGPGDGNSTGAVWAFTRVNGQWAQQGVKLSGSNAVASRYLGQSVSLSGDGNTAVAGAPGGVNSIFGHPAAIGATLVFTRVNSNWTQQGAPLVASPTATNDALQGTSVAISADGKTIITGGPVDDTGKGAAWIFTQPFAVSAPVITIQPASQTISSGQTATLNVTANGPAPLAYQWYQGTAGTTTTPVGTNSSSFTTPPLTTTTNYWVRVSNSFGSVDSNTAVVTVPSNSPVITQVFNAAGNSTTIAPNTWIAIQGTNLAPVGDTRQWQASDFANNQMPVQLDGVSATVNGKSAYVYYISPSQVNVLTPPDPIAGPVQVRVTRAGIVSAPFNVQAQAVSPGFFAFPQGYVAAEHADGSYLGPTTLYPGATTPARPGETVVLFGSGFGDTSPPVVPGSAVQSGVLPILPVIIIGGTAATVQFAGLVAPGEFQFNVVVPLSTPDGDNTLTAVYNGLSTQTGVLLTVAR